MSDAEASVLESRFLILPATRRDGELARETLKRARIDCAVCGTIDELCDELENGVAGIMLAEERMPEFHAGRLARWLREQPPWSDVPLLLLALSSAESPVINQAVELSGNVTVIERPTRIATLISAVRTALRARQQQYRARDYLAEQLEADRRKDEFLAVLAHELRNPLAPLRNSLHILRLTGRPDPTTDQVTGMMERQVEHMARLVEDLLEVSRITRGTIELRKEPVDLASIICGAVDTSKPLIEAAEHRLELALPPEPLIVDADPVRLTQVFANLLNNAAKYTNPGGRIRLEASLEGDEVVVCVQDNGIGIRPDRLTAIFGLFVQGDTDRGQGGLGIGLTLAKQLVEMHGGVIHADSRGQGEGSEFVVRLPHARAKVAGGARPALNRPAALTPRRVLVVDDNVDAAESMGMLLRLLGVDALVVHNGPDALAAFESYRPTVVLLDIGMPGMDGREVAKRIRSHPDGKDVTVIALTGWGQEEDRRRTMAAGFDHHLIKPADVNALRTLLTSLGGAAESGRSTSGRNGHRQVHALRLARVDGADPGRRCRRDRTVHRLLRAVRDEP